jgi:hypothetical protein
LINQSRTQRQITNLRRHDEIPVSVKASYKQAAEVKVVGESCDVQTGASILIGHIHLVLVLV